MSAVPSSGDGTVREQNVALREELRGKRGGDDTFRPPVNPKRPRGRGQGVVGARGKSGGRGGGARVAVPPVQTMGAKVPPLKQPKVAKVSGSG